MKFQANCGVEDFKTLIETQCTYVDKSIFLKDIFGEAIYSSRCSSDISVFLFLRPRRFGKTLTLSMIEHFCKLDYENVGNRDKARALFENLEIYKDKEFCNKHMAQYPVISISLKGVDKSEFTDSLNNLAEIISSLFDNIQQHEEFNSLPERLKYTVEYFNHIDKVDIFTEKGLFDLKKYINKSLKDLSQILYLLYKRKVIVLIDEYDTPLLRATEYGYYDRMAEVIGGMYSAALKGNGEYLEKAVLCGCMRVFKPSINSGLNNLCYFEIHDESFNTFIGFTKDEVRTLIQGTAIESYEDKILDYYAAYSFRGAQMLCPFSVLNAMDDAFFSSDVNNFKCKNFWANTSDNEIIDRFFTLNDAEGAEQLQQLVDGQSITIKSYKGITYDDIYPIDSFEDLMVLLMYTGYVTALAKEHDCYRVAIPNKEALYCFKQRADIYFNANNTSWYDKGLELKNALFDGDTVKAQNIIYSMFANYISPDGKNADGSFLLSVLSMFSTSNFLVLSGKETGKDYSDLSLLDRQLASCVIIQTRKVPSDVKDNEIEAISQQALAQIVENDYISGARDCGFSIIKYGIVFFGKACYIAKG